MAKQDLINYLSAVVRLSKKIAFPLIKKKNCSQLLQLCAGWKLPGAKEGEETDKPSPKLFDAKLVTGYLKRGPLINPFPEGSQSDLLHCPAARFKQAFRVVALLIMAKWEAGTVKLQ